MHEIPVLLLAAGGSSRMGQPKQLLPWGDQTLIEHQIQILLKTGQPVFVVLGASADLILPIIQKYAVRIGINQNWENGMGSSIACGINEMEKYEPQTDGVLITLADQPLIPLKHYEALLANFQAGKKQIIASKSNEDWLGVPALFDSIYFEELRQLKGERGAKTVIKSYAFNVIPVDALNQLEDIDTPAGYRRMQQRLEKE